jgi:protein-S-isoprenylcysteine O-methyltransferase Ste14
METFYNIMLISLYTFYSILRIHYRRKYKGEKEMGINKSKNQQFLKALIGYEVITFFLFIFLPDLFEWSSINISVIIRIAGVILGFSSIILFNYVHRSLGKNFTVKLKIKKDQELITNSAYKLIRHPMYTAFMMLHLSVFMICSNLFIGLSWILGLIAVLIPRMKLEENLLIEKFGEAYINYMGETKRLIPWII